MYRLICRLYREQGAADGSRTCKLLKVILGRGVEFIYRKKADAAQCMRATLEFTDYFHWHT